MAEESEKQAEAPAKEPEKKTPETEAKPEAAEKDPKKTAEKAGNEVDKAEKKVVGLANRFGASMRKLLRFDKTPNKVEKGPFFKGLAKSAIDIADAAFLTIPRRIYEITTSTGAQIRALFRTFNLFNLRKPTKYPANPARIGTASASTASAFINAPTRTLDEVVGTGIANPIARAGHHIPVVGGLVTGFGNNLRKAAHLPRQGTEWATSPITKADNWVKARQY